MRAWEKRYELWTPERGSGGQRLYSDEVLHLICHYLKGKISIAGEHLISSMGEHYLYNCIEQASQAAPEKERPPVLCSCFPEEEHRLGLLIVMYTLAREGCEPVYLGSSLPLESLELAIMQIQPKSVWLSVTSPVLYDKYRYDLAKLASRNSTPIFLGGQGVRAGDTLLLKSGGKLCLPLSSQPAAVQSFHRETIQ